MNISVRPIHGQQMLDAIYFLGQYSFRASPPFTDKEEWLKMVSGRKDVICHAVLEDDRPVSIANSSSMTQNMRGALYPASAIWGVGTHPSARRKGYCRMAMTSLLAAEREQGKVFSNLYPFRESFYERLGYVAFPLTRVARFATRALAPLLKLDLEGEVEMSLLQDVHADYRAFLTELRQRRHGMAFFDEINQERVRRNPIWAAIARVDGKVEGVMLYLLRGDEITQFTLFGQRFYSTTSRGRALLLNWIARHIDQAETTELMLPADEMPETWLSDLEIHVQTPPSVPMNHPPMSRVLDVASMGGMRVGPGNFSARVADPTCPWNEGAWRFEEHDGCLQVQTAAEAECELTIQGLSALVAGAHDPQDFALRGWGSPNSALQETMRRMFPRQMPHMHEVF